jgi:hypothetical protein
MDSCSILVVTHDRAFIVDSVKIGMPGVYRTGCVGHIQLLPCLSLSVPNIKHQRSQHIVDDGFKTVDSDLGLARYMSLTEMERKPRIKNRKSEKNSWQGTKKLKYRFWFTR